MGKRKNTDTRWNQGLKMGKRSKELIPRVKQWCEHVRIEESYGGMLGQIERVPTMVGISCPHTIGRYEGMNFEWCARDFIIENCRNCKFHKERFHKNFGREVLAKYEIYLQEKEKEKAERERAEKQLDEKIANLINKGEEQVEVSELSILKQIKRLRNADQISEALSVLEESSKIAPEFFQDTAINALELYLSDPSIRIGCLGVLCNLASDSGKISINTFKKAWNTFSSESHNSQEINHLAFLAKPFIKEENLEEFKDFLKWMIEGQRYERVPGTPFEKPDFDNCNNLLLLVSDLNLEFFRSLFLSYLKEINSDRRIIGANVLFKLIELNPEIGHHLYEDIIMAFELDDEMHGKADRVIQRILASLLIIFPNQTLQKIQEYESLLSDMAKEALWGTYEVYGILIRDEAKVPKGFEKVMNQLIQSFSKKDIKLEGAKKLAKAIQDYCRIFSFDCATFFDPILGGLTLWMNQVSEFQNLLETDEGKSISGQRFLEIQSVHTNLAVITRALEYSIQYLSKATPELAFSIIIPTIDSLSSKQHSLLKGKLISVLRNSLVKSSEIARIIPFLYKYVMDQDSVRVRVEAIRFLGDLLKKFPNLVPENLAEIVIIFGRDRYIGVVQETARIFQYVIPNSSNQVLELLGYFLSIEKQYFNQEPAFAYELGKAILNLSRGLNDSNSKTVRNILGRYATISNSEIREDAMARLARSAKATRDLKTIELWRKRVMEHITSEWDESAFYYANDLMKFIPDIIELFPEMEKQWAEIIILYLEKTKRDQYNSWQDEREKLIEKLYTFQTSTIQSIQMRLERLFKQRIESDSYDALQFSDLLIAFGFYELCKDALTESLSRIPIVKENEWIRKLIAIRISLLSIEIQIEIGELRSVIGSIEEARELIK